MLTTKEFIEKVESTGYKTEIGHRRIHIYKDEEAFDREIYCASIDPEEQFGMICNGRLSSSEVFDYLTEYAQTPIDKREKKGRIWIKGLQRDYYCLCYHPNDEKLLSIEHEAYKFDSDNIKSYVTETEKEEIERETGVPLVFLEE